MSQEPIDRGNKETVLRALEAWTAGDESQAASVLNPDFIQHNQEGGNWDATEVFRLMRLFSRAFPDRGTRVPRIVALESNN